MDKQYINNPYAPNCIHAWGYHLNNRSVEIIYKLDYTTVEPVLSGHPWHMVKKPLNIG